MVSLVPRREPEVRSNLISRGTETGSNKEGNYQGVICCMVDLVAGTSGGKVLSADVAELGIAGTERSVQ
jgi:hypothetical protein